MKFLTELYKKMTHSHVYRHRENWAILNGDLVCLRTTQCDECGKIIQQKGFLVATAEQLEEAYSKQIVMPH